MTLNEQILRTEEEYNAYSKANFACYEIILWLKSILESLYKLKELIMSDKKINIDTILLRHLKPLVYTKLHHDVKCIDNIKAAIKEIVEAVVDKCREEARYDWNEFHNPTINKESILNVKTLISYE